MVVVMVVGVARIEVMVFVPMIRVAALGLIIGPMVVMMVRVAPMRVGMDVVVVAGDDERVVGYNGFVVIVIRVVVVIGPMVLVLVSVVMDVPMIVTVPFKNVNLSVADDYIDVFKGDFGKYMTVVAFMRMGMDVVVVPRHDHTVAIAMPVATVMVMVAVVAVVMMMMAVMIPPLLGRPSSGIIRCG
jgi:hypothetical protein